MIRHSDIEYLLYYRFYMFTYLLCAILVLFTIIDGYNCIFFMWPLLLQKPTWISFAVCEFVCCMVFYTGYNEINWMIFPDKQITSKTFVLTHWTKHCAGSRFFQHKTKQLCTLLLKFVELHNQQVLSTILRHIRVSLSDDEPSCSKCVVCVLH